MIDKEEILASASGSRPLLILDLANNHNGSIEHGKKIISEMREVTRNCRFPVAIKFQYRDLPNFIHTEYQNRRDLKYVDRFLSTALSWEQMLELREFVNLNGMLAACTPFDEISVKKVIEHQFDILKIASASFTDWPLLEAAVDWEGPIVASTAGVSLEDIDRVVTFLKNRKKHFALMHCVAAYPTPNEQLQLSRIGMLRNRYPELKIGYSTHEDPSNFLAASIALAQGASILERHVGSSDESNVLNAYSSDKATLSHWISSLENAISMLGTALENPSNIEEKTALTGLRRYAFAKSELAKGKKVESSDIYYAIPGVKDQFQANDLGKYFQVTAKSDIRPGEPLTENNCNVQDNAQPLRDIRDRLLRFVSESNVKLPSNQVLEISHHYGIENYSSFGMALITLVNFEYCKKYLILLPKQTNPPHFHKHKDETFVVLHGNLTVTLNESESRTLRTGETLRILPGTIHTLYSVDGAIVEELSTKHVAHDSFYLDNKIAETSLRKSYIEYWS